MPVITTFGGMSARGFGLFSGGALQLATSFLTITAGTTTNTVPLGYNAVHIQAAVGGGALIVDKFSGTAEPKSVSLRDGATEVTAEASSESTATTTPKAKPGQRRPAANEVECMP